jgi:hypothetical protein
MVLKALAQANKIKKYKKATLVFQTLSQKSKAWTLKTP